MATDELTGHTILVVEDQPIVLLDLKKALARAGARVRGAYSVDDFSLSCAVLDGATPVVADELTARGLPIVFHSGRPPDAFARWPDAPVLRKPASAEAIVTTLARLLRPNGSAEVAPSKPPIATRDILITEVLRQRPTRSNSRVAQVRAFNNLSKLVMISPEAAVQRFLDLAVELCDAGSAGWSRLAHNDDGDEVFRWDAVAGELSLYSGKTVPRDFSPCTLCLDAGKTILLSRPARVFTYFDEIDVPIVEALIVPLYAAGGIALGTIWIAHHNDRQFDASDARVMEELTVQLELALKLMGDNRMHGQEMAAKLALIQDTDHRVKNTIQSVASLLSLQARSCKLPEARAAIQEASARLGIFATVHELLHAKGDDCRAVDIAEIIEKLGDALRAVRSDADRRVALRILADHILLEPNIALPIALFVNEAITNAYKHAYPDGEAGEIFVRIARTTNGGVRVGIQDDGVGVSPRVDEAGFGLSLMRSFAAQLGGNLAFSADNGTSIQLTFHAEPAEAHARTKQDRIA
jgi:two-component sensor histidine kinase